MSGTFHGLEVAKRGLYAQQSALSTTAHNIANANTEGYTRQRAEMQASTPIPYGGMNVGRTPGQLGTGVEVTKMVRLREEYLDVQLRGENKNLGYYEAKSDTLSKMEELLNEPSETGLAYTMDQFFNAWQELSKNPDSAAARAVVGQSGVSVAETFKYISNSLDQMQTDIGNVINTKIMDINSLATQISNLNSQISRLVPNNYQPNDLFDQRDVLIDQLSKLVDVKVTVDSTTGMATINVGNGSVSLVNGKEAKKFSINGFDPGTGAIKPDKIDLSSDITIDGNQISLDRGELLGRIEAYGITGSGSNAGIPNLKDKINDLAMTFANRVNSIHQSGLNLDNIAYLNDNTKGSTKKVDFFTGTTAQDLSVNQEILDSLNLIATAKVEDPTTGKSSTGNGEIAREMAEMKFDDLVFKGGSFSPVDYYSNIIAQLGIESQEAQRMLDNSDVIVQQVENRRQSVSGVSIDEEMANMIRFQQAYNAAARVVTVMDECLDKIINGMGRVGM